MLLIGCSQVWFGVSIAAAADEAPKDPQSWALLIGCEKYEKARILPFIGNDVQKLSETFRRRCGYKAECIMAITDNSPESLQPRKATLQAAIEKFLKQVPKGDRLVVYFSGHGFRSKEGKLFLAPLDIDPEKPEDAGLGVQWLRDQINACPASFKLLLLDACHAGSERTAENKDKNDKNTNSEDVGKEFVDLQNVFTIASSTASQPSQIWDEKEHSMFSYWLIEGLKGNADDNGNGQVTVDELFDYTYKAVKRTAERRGGRPQTPVRIVRAGVEGVPTVAELAPQSLRSVLDDVAEQLADKITEQKLSSVGVLEFINDTEGGEMLGANFGLLGQYCAEELERRLIELGEGRFSVVDRRRMREALSERQFAVADLSSSTQMALLSQTVKGGMPVIVVGKLKGDYQTDPAKRNPRVLHLQCRLTQTEGNANLGSAGATAQLNETEWAMIGRSVVVKPEDRQPERVKPGEKPKSSEDRVVREADERSKGPHPFADSRFPYRVRVMVDGKERSGELQGNDWIVKLRKGEVYELDIENKTPQPVAARVLIDGLNTLAEEESTKGVSTWITGKRVSLDTARFWILDPNDKDTYKANGVPTWRIPGFTSTAPGDTSTNTEMRRFKVVDAASSLAARRQFTDQIGLITVAFHVQETGGGKGVGTDAGDKFERKIERVKGAKAGNLIAVVHIKYVDGDEK
jgi:hypothetical protein